jgi:hypothetical protein
LRQFGGGPEGQSDLRVFCQAVVEGVRFLEPEAIFNSGE